MFLIKFFSVFRYKVTVGMNREKGKLGGKKMIYDMRLHGPFTKQVRGAQCCEGEFSDN